VPEIFCLHFLFLSNRMVFFVLWMVMIDLGKQNEGLYG
jgi:hypothetical protein